MLLKPVKVVHIERYSFCYWFHSAMSTSLNLSFWLNAILYTKLTYDETYIIKFTQIMILILPI